MLHPCDRGSMCSRISTRRSVSGTRSPPVDTAAGLACRQLLQRSHRSRRSTLPLGPRGAPPYKPSRDGCGLGARGEQLHRPFGDQGISDRVCADPGFGPVRPLGELQQVRPPLPTRRWTSSPAAVSTSRCRPEPESSASRFCTRIARCSRCAPAVAVAPRRDRAGAPGCAGPG